METIRFNWDLPRAVGFSIDRIAKPNGFRAWKNSHFVGGIPMPVDIEKQLAPSSRVRSLCVLYELEKRDRGLVKSFVLVNDVVNRDSGIVWFDSRVPIAFHAQTPYSSFSSGRTKSVLSPRRDERINGVGGNMKHCLICLSRSKDIFWRAAYYV